VFIRVNPWFLKLLPFFVRLRGKPVLQLNANWLSIRHSGPGILESAPCPTSRNLP
jgi:hypothetical protein